MPSTRRSRQTRRRFCAQACQAVALAALGGSLPACGGGITGPSAPTLPNVNGEVVGRTVTLAIGSTSPLAAVGSAALLNSAAGNFLVARVAQDTFTALTATCTHFGCTISGFEGSVYVCPCHGSRFNTSGAVQRGPAERNLATFPTRFADGILIVSI